MGEEGLNILAGICASHIAADPELFDMLHAACPRADAYTEPVLRDLLDLAASKRA